MPILKKKIHDLLEANELASVGAQGKENRKILSRLVRIACDKETLVGWRAIIAIGLLARKMISTGKPRTSLPAEWNTSWRLLYRRDIMFFLSITGAAQLR